MTSALHVSADVMRLIEDHGEAAYPEEGAGFLLGVEGDARIIRAILALPNEREDGARHNRFLIGPRDYLRAEMAADRLGLSLLGVFHSHPDHPNRPSEYDREWAQPYFSYIITSVNAGRASGSRSWRLAEDRAGYTEEQIIVASDRQHSIEIAEETTA